MDVPGQIINDRTMVPVRAVSEPFDAKVYWDNDTRTVRVYTEAYTEPEEPSEPENPGTDEPAEPKNPNEPSDPNDQIDESANAQSYKEALESFVKNGGILITTYMSGIVDQSDNVHLGGYPGPLRDMAGVWWKKLMRWHRNRSMK